MLGEMAGRVWVWVGVCGRGLGGYDGRWWLGLVGGWVSFGDVWVGDVCAGEGWVVVWGCWGEGECVRRFALCVGESGFGGMFGRVCGFLGGWLAGRLGGSGNES